MTDTYKFLKPYCYTSQKDLPMEQRTVLEFPYNHFGQLDPGELEEAEAKLGFQFPSQLRGFYQEIGVGKLLKPHIVPENYQTYVTNEILPPMVVANFSKGILLWEEQDHWMAESTYELLEPGDLPFFEISDSTSFMVLKSHSDNPNAVWYMGREKVEDSFEKFIWNLYYDHPSYYTRNW